MKDKTFKVYNCNACQDTGIIWGKGFPVTCPYCVNIIL